MASPQIENGFLRLSNELAEALMRAPLNGSQFRIALTVARECYGRNGGQKVASLSLRRIAAMTEIDLRRVRREVATLLNAGLISRQQPNGSSALYGLCKDYDLWKIGKRQSKGGGELAHGGKLTPGADLPTGEGANSPPKEGANLPTLRRKKNSLKKGRAKKPHAPERLLLESTVTVSRDYAFRKFQDVKKQSPVWDSKHYVHLARLFKIQPSLTVEEFSRRWDSYMVSTEPFITKQGGSLAFFCTNFDRFIDGPLHGTKASNGQGLNLQAPIPVGTADRRRQAGPEVEAEYAKYQRRTSA